MSSDFYKHLKVDNPVIIYNRYHKLICKVIRFTKTLIIVGPNKRSEYRFRRDSGEDYGGNIWNRWYLQEGTKEAIDKIKLNERKSKAIDNILECGRGELMKLSIAELQRMASLIKNLQNKK